MNKTERKFFCYLLSALVTMAAADIGYQHTQACENRANYFYSLCK